MDTLQCVTKEKKINSIKVFDTKILYKKHQISGLFYVQPNKQKGHLAPILL